MIEQNIRWIQRLDSYKKAFRQLEIGVEIATDGDLSSLEKEGIIKRFEYNQDLAWKVIKDFCEYIGKAGIFGSRDAFQVAVTIGLVDANCGDVLMASIKSRNETIHIYNEETANEIFMEIFDNYYQAFKTLLEALQTQKNIRNL
jgi:nucleotidyltransferase substrate binding protein (TIGR01987 family)